MNFRLPLAVANQQPSTWPFDDPPNVATITLRRIFENAQPILRVSHDEDDHGWLFLDGEPVTDADAMIVGLRTIVLHDPSILELADLPLGWTATRTHVGAAWTRTPAPSQGTDV